MSADTGTSTGPESALAIPQLALAALFITGMLVMGMFLGFSAITGVFIPVAGCQRLATQCETRENSKHGCDGMETFHCYCSFFMECTLTTSTQDNRGLRLCRQVMKDYVTDDRSGSDWSWLRWAIGSVSQLTKER